jgi:hypothetical protein
MIASIYLTALAWPMLASANYVESVDGDLSGDHLNPTSVALVANGSTMVSGTVEGAGMATSVDLDYFTVSVPIGQRLDSLIVRDGTSGGGMTGIFFGMFPGATGPIPAASCPQIS